MKPFPILMLAGLILGYSYCSGLPDRTYEPPVGMISVTNLDPLYSSYTNLLTDYVENGNVDYAGMCKDPRLEKVMQGFRSVDTTTIETREQGLAFWINAYNAFTLDLICLGYPVESINDLHGAGGLYTSTALGQTIWKIHKFPVGNNQYTLDGIEHQILRPDYNDYRIHAGIVCASVSCPLLLTEAFTPERIDEQLDEQLKEFLASEIRNRIDPKTRTIYLSRIFKWFEKDFTGGKTPLINVLWKYFPFSWQESMESPENALRSWDVQYLDYDWSLNGK
ncbi:MAG: DUF547 domain-containing protein [Leptospiraceae bacterium]